MKWLLSPVGQTAHLLSPIDIEGARTLCGIAVQESQWRRANAETMATARRCIKCVKKERAKA